MSFTGVEAASGGARTDSVAPVATPCRIRIVMCVLYELLFAAPIVVARNSRQQIRNTGRLPNIMEAGRMAKAPTCRQNCVWCYYGEVMH